MNPAQKQKVTRSFEFTVQVDVDPDEDQVETIERFYRTINNSLVLSPYSLSCARNVEDAVKEEDTTVLR